MTKPKIKNSNFKKRTEMTSRFLTKVKLIAVNNKAKNAGGNYIDPDFVASLPDRFRYPVCPAMPYPLEGGWLRCWLTVGPDDPVIEENIQSFLLSMPMEIFSKLPQMPEPLKVER